MSLDLEEVGITNVVKQIDKLLKPLAERKGILVRLNLAATQTVIADEEKVGQVVRNLLGNAIKFSPEGGLIEVAITDDCEKEGVLLSVKDHGPGISQQEQELIFESFYQAGKIGSQESGGYGLGLALVKKIVDLHLGWIKVESSLGQGAAFYVFWPAYPPLDDNLE
jgi:signal transduction histidine kinase